MAGNAILIALFGQNVAGFTKGLRNTDKVEPRVLIARKAIELGLPNVISFKRTASRSSNNAPHIADQR